VSVLVLEDAPVVEAREELDRAKTRRRRGAAAEVCSSRIALLCDGSGLGLMGYGKKLFLFFSFAGRYSSIT
jgi:hypothetical protein